MDWLSTADERDVFEGLCARVAKDPKQGKRLVDRADLGHRIAVDLRHAQQRIRDLTFDDPPYCAREHVDENEVAVKQEVLDAALALLERVGISRRVLEAAAAHADPVRAVENLAGVKL